MGPGSQRLLIARTFLGVLFLLTGWAAIAANPPGADLSSPTPNPWSGSASLDSQMGSNPTVTVDFFLDAAEWDYSTATANGELVFTLSTSSSSPLPTDTEVAEVTVSDGSIEQQFRVYTDGGGMVILVDEF